MFKTVLNAVGEALSHRELIPLVSLEEKRAREEAMQKERLTPRPEPFEVRRRQTLENGGTTVARANPTPHFRQIIPVLMHIRLHKQCKTPRLITA